MSPKTTPIAPMISVDGRVLFCCADMPGPPCGALYAAVETTRGATGATRDVALHHKVLGGRGQPQGQRRRAVGPLAGGRALRCYAGSATDGSPASAIASSASS